MTAALWKEDVELGGMFGQYGLQVLSDFVYRYAWNHEKVSFSATKKKRNCIIKS